MAERSDDILATFIAAMAEAAKQIEERPKTSSEYLAWLTKGENVACWIRAIDGNACTCGGQDGIVLSVGKGSREWAGDAIEARHRIQVILFDHEEGPSVVQFGVEAARELVNRLTEAIAVGEQIDAEEATRA